MIEEKSIKISDLLFWDENYRTRRFISNPTQKNIMLEFISNPKYKIYELAKGIANSIDVPPSERIIVWKDENDNNIVGEGNRRLAAYRAIIDPSKIKDDPIRKKFEELHEIASDLLSNKLNSIELDCLVMSEAQAKQYIESKHNNPNSFVGWGEHERLHFKKDAGEPLSKKELLKLEVENIMEELVFPSKMEVLDKGSITTLWRLLPVSSFDFLGITYDEKNKSITVKGSKLRKALRVISNDILTGYKYKGMELSRLQGKEIHQYLTRAINADVKNLNTIDLRVTGKEDKPNPKSTVRPHLIPKSCVFIIEEGKINDIYLELKDNLLIDDSDKSTPNAVGVLFRVFLEISLERYAQINGHTFVDRANIPKKIDWVSEELIKAGVSPKKLKEINQVSSATQKNSFLAVENFHQYVHSTNIMPSSSDLKNKWDLLEGFFRILWKNIQASLDEKESKKR